ncbi:VIT1/CCC1 transporter family protein [Xylanibacter oryzae]|uniref:VIT1/CCC1 transporter family protein n=1 Tax=Xylanibacter oryzae TaxID=185293 RepID=UPI0004B2D19B|nr:VIT1/CCC1 transporter family protein [Xylanibacter oryzae]
MTDKELKEFINFQQEERDAVEIYKRLGNRAKSNTNRDVLLEMSKEEYGHYDFISKYTGRQLSYNKFKVFITCFLANIFGLMFVLKLLEKEEGLTASSYANNETLAAFAKTEDKHEERLLNMIDERFLQYMGSIVLGLNDALVEFTGALAGYTLALGNCSMVALTGSITGIAAALSMGSSEYLSTKSDGGTSKHAIRSALYTLSAYLVTVFILIAPYIWISRPIMASCIMLLLAITIIAVFNFYYSVVRNEKFHKRFGEMALISLSVALLSFAIGYLLKEFTGIGG